MATAAKSKAPKKATTAPAGKRYELVKTDTMKSWDGRKLFRIRALVAIDLSIAAGDLGGYVEKEANLSQVSGNAWVSGDAQFGWLSHVGSENGTLSWFIERDRTIRVNRGCFNGTIDEFDAAVAKTHGESADGQQYRLLIQFIRLRADEALKSYQVEDREAA